MCSTSQKTLADSSGSGGSRGVEGDAPPPQKKIKERDRQFPNQKILLVCFPPDWNLCQFACNT